MNHHWIREIHSVQEEGRKLKVYQELLATQKAKQKKVIARCVSAKLRYRAHNVLLSLETGMYFQCDQTKKIHLKIIESCGPIKSPNLSAMKTVFSGKPMPQGSRSEITGLKSDLNLPPVGLQGYPPEFSAPGLTQFTLALCLEVPLLLVEQYFP